MKELWALPLRTHGGKQRGKHVHYSTTHQHCKVKGGGGRRKVSKGQIVKVLVCQVT